MTKDDVEKLHKAVEPPFILDKDTEYYPAVQSKLLALKNLLKAYGADESVLNIADKFRQSLCSLIREYYKGNIAASHIKMINIIKVICDEDTEAVNDINDCAMFDGDKFDIPFFRARLDADEDGFMAKDMGVIPFSLRTKTTTERFSMPGLPCLYLGNTSYVCWLEMGKPADYRFNVSPVLLDRTQRLFDMTISTGYLFSRDDNGDLTFSPEITIGLVKRIMLMMCSSFRVKEAGRKFKSEYIVPQLIMLACQKKGLDGVAYISSKISSAGLFGVCAVNVALFAKYPKNTYKISVDKAQLTDHIDLDDSFNYATYKQIKHTDPLRDSPLWIDRCRWIHNVEQSGRQFTYWETEFYDFDKFLFLRWKDKKSS